MREIVTTVSVFRTQQQQQCSNITHLFPKKRMVFYKRVITAVKLIFTTTNLPTTTMFYTFDDEDLDIPSFNPHFLCTLISLHGQSVFSPSLPLVCVHPALLLLVTCQQNRMHRICRDSLLLCIIFAETKERRSCRGKRYLSHFLMYLLLLNFAWSLD